MSLRLKKGEEVKYVSHLQFMRAFEMALRRARIPVAYSEGFNPRPKMSFGGAIGVGVTSDDERIILELASHEEPSGVEDRLNRALPPGLRVLDAEAVPEGVKSPLSALNASEYRITVSCEGECDPQAIRDASTGLFELSEVRVLRVREKGTKEVDIRPYLLRVDKIESKEGDVVIEVSLRSSDSGGARPQDFVEALRRSVPNLAVERIHRLKQFHANDDSHERGV